jgi:hypothetical protein
MQTNANDTETPIMTLVDLSRIPPVEGCFKGTVGSGDGLALGVEVGWTEWSLDGGTVGTADGLAEGGVLGAFVGAAVLGSTVGPALGSGEGAAVGGGVGDVVGVLLGGDDGSAVGSLVSPFCVGLGVTG